MWNAQDAKMRKHNEANGGSFKMLCNFHIVRRMMFIVLNVHSFQKWNEKLVKMYGQDFTIPCACVWDEGANQATKVNSVKFLIEQYRKLGYDK